MARPHSCICPSVNTQSGVSGKKSTKIVTEMCPRRNLSNSGPSRVTRSLHEEVLTRSPITRKKKQKAGHAKNSFKKMVHSPSSSNSDIQDDSDCCKECEEYHKLKKQECDWIKCSVCEKLLHENCTIFSKTYTDYGRNIRNKDLEKRKKSTKKSHSDKEYRLFYLITILFATNLLFYTVRHLSPRICQRCPVA
jgi:hypothetical protein